MGVEIIEDAINDANFNAEDNQIQNCKFYTGNCDDYIHALVYEAKNENVLAVIDPPRGGLRKYYVTNHKFNGHFHKFIDKNVVFVFANCFYCF